MMIKNKKVLYASLVAALMAAPTAWAAVSEQEASRLAKELTPFGSERAGNSDGTIPEWKGGITATPASISFQSGDFHPDPFIDDEILFNITAENMDQYADKLSAGQQALLRKYPDSYRLPVYPSRRSHALPDWVVENTRKNALSAELVDGGSGIQGAYGGVPFPVPGNGQEVLWNHLLRWQGEAATWKFSSLVIQPGGQVTRGESEMVEQFPFYQKGGTADTYTGDFWKIMVKYQDPSRRKGEVLLLVDPINQAATPRKAWQYLPGQRRVRRAPTVAYDTPNPNFNGVATYDDAFLFNGAPDRYDWKLVGKKEMYIPYNNYRQESPGSYDEIMTPGHTNPDYARWELHRVWVVEGSLKDGARHVYAKRTFYIDEDSWVIALADSYDGRGQLWRTGVQHSKNAFELPGVVGRSHIHYDLLSGVYGVNVAMNEQKKGVVYTAPKKGEFFTPASLRRQSRR